MFNQTRRRNFRIHLLASAAVSGFVVVPAVSQEAGSTAQAVEKVTVTGSRLKKRDHNTTSPVTTIGAQTFELTQTNSVEKLLNDLPQLVPGNTFTSNNAGEEGENGFAEERNVQALIGGNSGDGKGNITIFGEYFSREGLLQSKQGFSRTSAPICYSAGAYSVCDSAEDAYAAIGAYGLVTIAGGSGTPPWGWITNNPSNPFQDLDTLFSGQFGDADTDCDPTTGGVAVSTGNLSFNDAGALTPRFAKSTTACLVPDRAAGSSRYNYAPDNFIVLPAERYNVSMFGHYGLSENLQFNFGAMYSDSFTRVQLVPTPATGIEVNYNPTLQAYIEANHPDLHEAL